MSRIMVAVLAAGLGCAGGETRAQEKRTEPISLHPDNPHYFLWRGKPTLLITSAEHYGAVLNLDFDYNVYLQALYATRMNHTRVWAGTYREIPGSFGITDNTLAPHPNRYLCPWARSATPGYSHGGNKFDLTKWDEEYFKRLKDFMTAAKKTGVVVEMNLWCPNYEESLWKASPMHVSNNVNGVGTCEKNDTYTLKHKDLLDVQEATTRKIVRELKDFDNLYYEVANEPYFGGVTVEWQHRIVDIIQDEEKTFPSKHLIAMNIANGRAKVQKPHPGVSIFNFHYCFPPDVVEMNYGLNKVIGENETGFRGKEDVLYRTEGWDFILAGGALYNNLDYSFTTKNHEGTFLDYKSPGGGSPALRAQLKILKDFMEGFDFVRMTPQMGVIQRAQPPGLRARALAEPGRQYAIYAFASLGGEEFSVRWSGQVEPEHTESYTFTTTSDDGVRLWVNDQKLIDNWTDHTSREDSGTIALEAGRKAKIVMEYSQGTAGAVAKLAWSSPSQKKQIIPKARLFLPDGKAGGLKGDYFAGRDFKTFKLTRTDPKVEFDWSWRGPFPFVAKEQEAKLILDLPAGDYRAEWLNPKTGQRDRTVDFTHAGGAWTVISPTFTEDVALGIRRR